MQTITESLKHRDSDRLLVFGLLTSVGAMTNACIVAEDMTTSRLVVFARAGGLIASKLALLVCVAYVRANFAAKVALLFQAIVLLSFFYLSVRKCSSCISIPFKVSRIEQSVYMQESPPQMTLATCS
jgi:hypothetical protein